uniref:Uncharacterized protein n=1 Tax=Echinococcus granulosus TaxID=6210 RepID=A0A068WQD3_ECHGR|nr:hypothetical protein EgrG_002028800 [Echinococcus granulosus]
MCLIVNFWESRSKTERFLQFKCTDLPLMERNYADLHIDVNTISGISDNEPTKNFRLPSLNATSRLPLPQHTHSSCLTHRKLSSNAFMPHVNKPTSLLKSA